MIVVAHRPSAIAALDDLMVLKDGAQIVAGPKKDVLEKVLAKPEVARGKPGSAGTIRQQGDQ